MSLDQKEEKLAFSFIEPKFAALRTPKQFP
jgi:hypothetical protein